MEDKKIHIDNLYREKHEQFTELPPAAWADMEKRLDKAPPKGGFNRWYWYGLLICLVGLLSYYGITNVRKGSVDNAAKPTHIVPPVSKSQNAPRGAVNADSAGASATAMSSDNIETEQDNVKGHEPSATSGKGHSHGNIKHSRRSSTNKNTTGTRRTSASISSSKHGSHSSTASPTASVIRKKSRTSKASIQGSADDIQKVDSSVKGESAIPAPATALAVKHKVAKASNLKKKTSHKLSKANKSIASQSTTKPDHSEDLTSGVSKKKTSRKQKTQHLSGTQPETANTSEGSREGPESQSATASDKQQQKEPESLALSATGKKNLNQKSKLKDKQASVDKEESTSSAGVKSKAQKTAKHASKKYSKADQPEHQENNGSANGSPLVTAQPGVKKAGKSQKEPLAKSGAGRKAKTPEASSSEVVNTGATESTVMQKNTPAPLAASGITKKNARQKSNSKTKQNSPGEKAGNSSSGVSSIIPDIAKTEQANAKKQSKDKEAIPSKDKGQTDAASTLTAKATEKQEEKAQNDPAQTAEGRKPNNPVATTESLAGQTTKPSNKEQQKAGATFTFSGANKQKQLKADKSDVHQEAPPKKVNSPSPKLASEQPKVQPEEENRREYLKIRQDALDGQDETEGTASPSSGGGGGGGSFSGGWADDNKFKDRKKAKFEFGVKAGYEMGIKEMPINKFVAAPFVEYYLSNRFSIGVQPAIKTGNVSGLNAPAEQSYYKPYGTTSHWVKHDSTTPGAIGPSYYIKHFVQTYDSIVLNYQSSSRVLEFEFPVILGYHMPSGVGLFAGLSATTGKTASIAMQTRSFSNLQQFDSSQRYPDNIDTSTQFVDPSNLFHHSAQLYPSAGVGSQQSPSVNPLRIGCMLGFSYSRKYWLFEISWQKNISGLTTIQNEDLRKSYSQSYFRAMLGVKLGK